MLCLRVKTSVLKFEVRAGFMLGLGGFVGMVRVQVRSWGMHHAYGSPHKDESTRISVQYYFYTAF